jgi:chemotaxis protein methyltransferase CheR
MTFAPPATSRMTDEQFEFFTKYLASRYGLKIQNEKRVLLESRIISRVNALRLNSVQEYIEHTFRSKNAAEEYPYFIDQVTTHKTFFFRENYQFQFLESILPSYCAKFIAHRPLTVWSAGCSTGEEVYTIGMTLQEKKNEMTSLDYRIVGTDVSIPSLQKAARASYSLVELENIPEHYKQKYFTIESKNDQPLLQFRAPEITSRIKLGALNLNNKFYNLPGEFDFIFCRNVTIYFDAKTRGEVLTRMVAKLKPGGYLFLGHSETALGTNLPIKSIQPTIYQKIIG